MTAINTSGSIPYLKDLRRWLAIRGLYMLHWLTGWRLELYAISKPPAILFSGTSLTLRWRVSGCHRIVINNRLILQGNAASVQLNPSLLSGVLQIRFEGCRHTVEKSYAIGVIYLKPKQLSVASMKDPRLRALKMYEKPGPRAIPQADRVVLPSPDFPLALQFTPQSRPAFRNGVTLRCPSRYIQLEPCELPQLLN